MPRNNTSALNILEESRHLLFIVIGIVIFSIGFTVFVLPHHIVVGGMAGFGTLVYYATGQIVPIAVIMYATNITLLILSYRVLGHAFVLRTIFGATVLSLTIGALEGYFISHPPVVADTAISVLMGSVLMGFGIGIYFSHNGTTGGTDIIAAVMSRYSTISVGQVMMVVDISIVACSFLLPFDGDMEARVQARAQSIIYGWASIFIYSYVTDKFLYQGRQTVQFIILSDKWESIAHRITHETGRGVTTWDATGYWTGTPRKLMMVWCRQSDTPRIYKIVLQEDATAYITDCPVRGVYGNGFDALKNKVRGTSTLSH